MDEHGPPSGGVWVMHHITSSWFGNTQKLLQPIKMDLKTMVLSIYALSSRLTIISTMTFTDIVNNNTKIPCLAGLQEGLPLCRIQVQETLVDIDNKLLT